LVLMRGAFTPPPTMLVPVVWMPRAAPTTDSETESPMPRQAHMYGFDEARNQPTLTRSPLPVITKYRVRMVATARKSHRNVWDTTVRIWAAILLFLHCLRVGGELALLDFQLFQLGLTELQA